MNVAVKERPPTVEIRIPVALDADGKAVVLSDESFNSFEAALQHLHQRPSGPVGVCQTTAEARRGAVMELWLATKNFCQ